MHRLLVGIVLTLALVVAGCGGDDKGGSSGGGGSDDWQAEVNSICTTNQEEIQKIASEVASGGETDPAKAAAELLERSVEVEENLIGELRDVSVPSDVEGDYNAFLDRIDDTLPLFEDLSDVLRDGKEDPELTEKLAAIASDTRPFAEENNLDACLSDAAPAETPAP